LKSVEYAEEKLTSLDYVDAILGEEIKKWYLTLIKKRLKTNPINIIKEFVGFAKITAIILVILMKHV
jgi:hypothetical protein